MRYIFRLCISFVLWLFPHNIKVQNFLMWPLARRLLGGGYVETVNIGGGIRMNVYADMHDMVNKILLFYSGRVAYAWEPVTTRLFIQLAKQAGSIVIAGGHLGYYALIAAKHNPEARIDTFEPVSKIYERLRGNIALNEFDTIHANHMALSDHAGELAINVDDGQSSMVQGKKSLPQESVAATTLDVYCAQEKIKPNLILLDVEGYEHAVLSGATGVLTAKPDMIIEVNPQMMQNAGVSEDQFTKSLKAMGYALYFILDDYSHSSTLSVTDTIRVAPFDGKISNFNASFANILATVKQPRELEDLKITVRKAH